MKDETRVDRASTPAPPAPGPPRRAGRAMLVVGAAALLAAGFGIASRVRAKSSLRDETQRTAAPVVSVIEPERGAPAREVVLPGSVRAFTDAPIYARTSGYLKKWYFDIGAHVKKGQRLADVDSPEIEQQLQAARADLATAQANERLAKITSDRFAELSKSDSVSKQEADNAAGALAARRAATESAQANVRRLEQLVAFEKIEAPFDGVITARNTDVGQLVDAGSSGGPARELFRMATTGTLRVFLNVPQASAAAAAPGLPVELTVAERPGHRYQGTIARTANSIDPATGTLLVEVNIRNAGGEILPGAYAEVHLKLPSGSPAWMVPVSALMFRAEGPRVATLGAGNRALLRPVTLGRDYGTKVEVTSGLEPGSRVIDSPPDSLVDGQEVRPVFQTAKPGGPGGPPAK